MFEKNGQIIQQKLVWKTHWRCKTRVKKLDGSFNGHTHILVLLHPKQVHQGEPRQEHQET